jgi:hypothetical protein
MVNLYTMAEVDGIILTVLFGKKAWRKEIIC